ncbi:TetR/AcrR family transcriptional regulator [Nocardia sp. NPDC057455]|uniref:TetR/AcrR family transcriptional regulator n=1 Tax=Nocardia sp. NPDC057455 TaxID=3346138 RepID=UPI003671FD10
MSSRIHQAVERALDERQRAATEEVERILEATVRVMTRNAPAAPRLSEILAEANSSNKAFYRYFTSKDDLVLAVLERGVGIVVSYIEHQMAKETDPASKIARWIEGALAQLTEPHLVSMSHATFSQLTAGKSNDRVTFHTIMRPLRDLLSEPVAALGQPDAVRDADMVFFCVTDSMRRYVEVATQPTRADIGHLVEFCLRGIGAFE